MRLILETWRYISTQQMFASICRILAYRLMLFVINPTLNKYHNVMLCHVMSCHVMSYHISHYHISYCVILCYVMLCYAMLYCPLLCYVILHYVILYYSIHTIYHHQVKYSSLCLHPCSKVTGFFQTWKSYAYNGCTDDVWEKMSDLTQHPTGCVVTYPYWD